MYKRQEEDLEGETSEEGTVSDEDSKEEASEAAKESEEENS